LKGLDEKFDKVVERFGLFAQYAKAMDEKLDKLPERIAQAISKRSTRKMMNARRCGAYSSTLALMEQKIWGMGGITTNIAETWTNLKSI